MTIVRYEPWANPNILYPDEAQVLHSLPTKPGTLSVSFYVQQARFGTAPTTSGSPILRPREVRAAHAPGRSGGCCKGAIPVPRARARRFF